jgi:hypothetical protein
LPRCPLPEPEPLLIDNIETCDAQIASIVTDQSRDVIIPDEQQIYRHIFTVAEQMVFALGEFQVTSFKQVR